MSGGSGSSGSSNGLGGMPSGGYAGTAASYGGTGFGAGYSGNSGGMPMGGYAPTAASDYGKATYGEGMAARTALDKNTGSLIAGGLLGLLGIVTGTSGVLVGGKMVSDAASARPALNQAFDDFSLAHPETAAYIESERGAAMDEAMAGAFGGGDGGGAPAAEQQTSSAKAAAAAAKAASDTAAADKAKAAQAAADKAATAKAAKAAEVEKIRAATAKAVADKAKTDEEAKTKATLLAKRRQASQSYYTSGGAQGLLGQAPVQLKTLLGE